jgi:hypothetical protein
MDTGSLKPRRWSALLRVPGHDRSGRGCARPRSVAQAAARFRGQRSFEPLSGAISAS